MPCFLFTYHAHGTWLPNRSRGYVKRGQGILPPDAEMHRRYSQAMKEPEVNFSETHQKQLILEVLQAATHQSFQTYFVSTDTTHVHILIGWRHAKSGKVLKSQLKWSLSRLLNRKFGERDWLAEGGSCKQVKDHNHFDYLRNVYLPKHNGWKWQPLRGLYQ
jgi:REP element-mobilizing transposase RayT